MPSNSRSMITDVCDAGCAARDAFDFEFGFFLVFVSDVGGISVASRSPRRLVEGIEEPSGSVFERRDILTDHASLAAD